MQAQPGEQFQTCRAQSLFALSEATISKGKKAEPGFVKLWRTTMIYELGNIPAHSRTCLRLEIFRAHSLFRVCL